MDEVNYNETIILPFLEKKSKDLLGVNLVLEARLLAEMEKSRVLQAKIDLLQSKIDSMKKSKKKATDGATAEALDGETY